MSDNGGTTKVLCSASLSNGKIEINFDENTSVAHLSLAVMLINKQFDKILDGTFNDKKSSVISISPDILNRIRK